LPSGYHLRHVGLNFFLVIFQKLAVLMPDNVGVLTLIGTRGKCGQQFRAGGKSFRQDTALLNQELNYQTIPEVEFSGQFFFGFAE
jgi:hypothetical protein